MRYKSSNANHTRTEHVSFWVINLGYKEITGIRDRLNNTLLSTNQESASINRWGHGDWKISFGSWKSCNKMSTNFGRNTNDSIAMNPSRTTRSIIPQTISLKSDTEMQRIGLGWNSNDSIPPRNIGSFNLSNRGTSDFPHMTALWHGAAKSESESENPEGNRILKTMVERINLKL